MTASVETLIRLYQTTSGTVFFRELGEQLNAWIVNKEVGLLNEFLKAVQPAEGKMPYNSVAILRTVLRTADDLEEYTPLLERAKAYLPAVVGKDKAHKYLWGLTLKPKAQRRARRSLGYDSLASVMASMDHFQRSIISDHEMEIALQHLEQRRKEGATPQELDADPKLTLLAQAFHVSSWVEMARDKAAEGESPVQDA